MQQKIMAKCTYRHEEYKAQALNQSGGSESVLGENSFCPEPGKSVRVNQVKNMGCIPGRMNNLSKGMDT